MPITFQRWSCWQMKRKEKIVELHYYLTFFFKPWNNLLKGKIHWINCNFIQLDSTPIYFPKYQQFYWFQQSRIKFPPNMWRFHETLGTTLKKNIIPNPAYLVCCCYCCWAWGCPWPRQSWAGPLRWARCWSWWWWWRRAASGSTCLRGAPTWEIGMVDKYFVYILDSTYILIFWEKNIFIFILSYLNIMVNMFGNCQKI